jgi:hypothetical protein
VYEAADLVGTSIVKPVIVSTYCELCNSSFNSGIDASLQVSVRVATGKASTSKRQCCDAEKVKVTHSQLSCIFRTQQPTPVASRSNHPSVRIIPANTAGTDDCSLSVNVDRIVEGGMITSCQDLATPPVKNIKKISTKHHKMRVTVWI